ncbi:MAG: ester cyclase [Bacteroidetes bacterium]|nr:ester cyclase [Bacteroidota bacterium]
MTGRLTVVVLILGSIILQWACSQNSGPTAEEQQNLSSVKRIYAEFINQGNEAVFDELVDPNVIENKELPPGLEPNREGVKQLFRMFRSAFPDLHFQVDEMIAADDKIVTRVTITGTHQGTFMNMPPTGNKISYKAIDIFRLINGKVVEHWGIGDNAKMMQQLAVVPEGSSKE